jgi:hypothetical protein
MLSFSQPLSFSSVLPKPLSETLTRSSDGRNPVKLTVGWCWQVGPLLVPRSGHVSTYPDHCGTRNLSTLAHRTHSLPRCPLQNGSPSQPRAHARARAIASPFFSGRRVMSSFSSTSRSSWPQYGPMPLTRCPNCPCQEPLKRSICKTNDNSNRGCEFLACESLPYREGDKVRSRSNCSVFSRFSCYSLKFGI